MDDGDALPAVGKVWDTGPKRSLSEIFAAQNAKAAAQAEATPAAAATIESEFQPIWGALLQQAQQRWGNSVYLPLVAAQPRREGDVLVVSLSGPFVHVGAMLQKYRDQLEAMLAEIGTPLGVRLELNAAVPTPAAPPAQPAAAAPRSQPSGPAVASPTQQSAIAAVPARDGIPLTPELRQELEKDPLIRSLLVGFNGTIVKVEQK